MSALGLLPTPTRGLLLRRAHVQAMREHVAAQAPLEACGVMAVQQGISQRVYLIPNELASPVRYRLEPRAYLQALQDMDAHGWYLGLIFHSHPHGVAVPSPRDLAEASYPDAVYYIWARRGATWVARGYWLTASAARPAPVRWE